MRRGVLALVFGGASPEHDVSLVSAKGICDHLDRDAYELILVGVDRAGQPRVGGPELLEGALEAGGGTPVSWPASPGERALRSLEDGRPVTPPLDVAFPIIHGASGEDGVFQGVMAWAGVRCVGAGVLGSALAMDKDRARRMLESEGIPVVEDLVLPEGCEDVPEFQAAASELGFPLFVKPARAGSSVGISKVNELAELHEAIQAARTYDPKVVIERAVASPREIEVAVLGAAEEAEASVPGEIVPHGEFYTYESKYEDAESKLLIPAPLERDQVDEVRSLALSAFRALDLHGLARVDFLLSRDEDTLVLNEVNTLPGFTPISMYPRLWEASGVSYRVLLDRLIALAR